MIQLQDVLPNPDQPRKYFDETALNQLAQSIAREGVLNPILVRKLHSGKFEIIDGERRFRAASNTGLKVVPAIVKDVNDAVALELSIVETIQRENLSVVEEAQAYKVMIDRYSYSQTKIAAKIGKTQSHVANLLRLLSLPEPVLADVRTGEISSSHARLLIGHDNAAELAKEIKQRSLNVRETEELLKNAKRPDAERGETAASKATANETAAPPKRKSALTLSQAQNAMNAGALVNTDDRVDADVRVSALEQWLSAKLGMKVKIDDVKHQMIILYSSLGELEKLETRVE